MTKLRLRIDFGPDKTRSLGPGKVRLLESIDELGSISAAARSMGMAYRRAWLLVDSINQCFKEPAVTTRKGGRAQGGAVLTAFGKTLIERYRTIEHTTRSALAAHLQSLEADLSDPRPDPAPAPVEDCAPKP